MKKFLCSLLTIVLVLSSLSVAFATDENAFTPYPETVKVTMGRETVRPLELPDGDDQENNKYIKFIEDKLNIDISYDWIADGNVYNDKVNLAITGGQIPDIMYVNSQSQLKQLVDNDMIEDLTEYYEEYFSDDFIKRYEDYGPRGLDSSTFGGKIMAIPNLNGGYEFSFLWVRRDWVEKVGAEMPTTMDEVIDLARLFMEEDPNGNGEGKTIGIAFKSHVAGMYNNLGNIDPLFGAYEAFPRQWMRAEDGTISYGTIAPETREALEKIADLYAEGVLDKEFAVRTDDEFNSLLLSGRCGMFFGPWWMPDWPLNSALANDPAADWVPVLAPLDNDGDFNVYRQQPNNQWLVVRKGYEHPEVIFKMLSTIVKHQSDEECENFYPGISVIWTIWPGIMIYRAEDTIPQDYKLLRNAVDTGDTSELNQEEMNVYKQAVEYLESGDPAGWQVYTCRLIGPEVTTHEEVKAFDNVYPLMTESMEVKWSYLEKLENEMLLKIIMGEMSIDDFDTFVENWTNMGGEEITAEVNEQFN